MSGTEEFYKVGQLSIAKERGRKDKRQIFLNLLLSDVVEEPL